MITTEQTLKPPSRLLFALELRTLPELGGFIAALPLLTALAPRGDGHPARLIRTGHARYTHGTNEARRRVSLRARVRAMR